MLDNAQCLSLLNGAAPEIPYPRAKSPHRERGGKLGEAAAMGCQHENHDRAEIKQHECAWCKGSDRDTAVKGIVGFLCYDFFIIVLQLE